MVLGVEEHSDGTPRPTGVSSDQADSWNYDEASASIAAHADPFVTFTREIHSHNGLVFVVFIVSEFESLPVLCRKQFHYPNNPKDLILREGVCYVRTRKKPETTAIASQTEMRELLDLAIDKGVKAFVARAVATGVWSPVAGIRPPSDDDRFAAQVSDLR